MRLEQVAKTMLVERLGDQVVMVLVSVDRRLSLQNLAQVLGEENGILLSARRVKTATGYELGSVSPIGVRRRHLQILIDPEVRCEESVPISAGNPNADLVLQSKDLVEILEAEFAAVTRSDHENAPRLPGNIPGAPTQIQYASVRYGKPERCLLGLVPARARGRDAKQPDRDLSLSHQLPCLYHSQYPVSSALRVASRAEDLGAPPPKW